MKKAFGVAAVFLIVFAAMAGCIGKDDVHDERPIAEIRIDNVAISQGVYHTSTNVPVKFNGSLSFDIDGEIKSYLWTFGDGGFAYTETVSHVYLEEGTYTVYLTVRDNKGNTDSAMVYVMVAGDASFGVKVGVATKKHLSSPGGETDFALIVENMGNVEDTFDFKSGDDLPVGWTFRALFSTITLLPGEKKINILTYKVSPTASKVATDVSYRVTSTIDPTTYATGTLTVDVKNPGLGPAEEGNLVKCQYIGWFDDGEVFDSSLEAFSEGRGDVPLKVNLGDSSGGEYISVIPGFKNALLGMRVGEVNVVRLTPEEGYQDGQYRIFQIELVSIDG
ncbi:MAG TPA: PKD domain-containing protein [Euryarchaeota archaeon]|nr:PKD domain-containing protein [Euryarchaeota archaeon]